MSVFSESFAIDLLAFITCLVISFLLCFKWKLTYWTRRGVPTLSPSIPFGDAKFLITKRINNGEILRRFYEKFKSRGHQYGGIYVFGIPIFIPIGLDLVERIVIKDFQYFVNRGNYCDEEDDPLSCHLFNLKDKKWKDLRVKLTPTFTSGKMKMMFGIFVKCAESLQEIFDECAKKKTPVDIKETMARFTTDTISSCAFGLEVDSLKNPNCSIRYYGKKIFDQSPFEAFKVLIGAIAPPHLLKMIRFKGKMDVHNFFLNVIKRNVDYRERNDVRRKDFLHLLLQLKNRGELSDDERLFSDRGKREISLTVNEIAAQCYVFFFAGYETSSTLITFLCYELSIHPEIQDKIRDEIREVLFKSDGVITYEAVQEMKYTEQAMNEALRKYPPLPFLPRRCTKPYQIPGTSVIIEKETSVMIPLEGIHNDPEYYPDPERFDPERFSDENKAKIPNCAFMPFGEGPRICIGLRFGVLQAKMGVIALLKNYRITLDKKKTIFPAQFDPIGVTLAFKGGLWVNLEPVL